MARKTVTLVKAPPGWAFRFHAMFGEGVVRRIGSEVRKRLDSSDWLERYEEDDGEWSPSSRGVWYVLEGTRTKNRREALQEAITRHGFTVEREKELDGPRAVSKRPNRSDAAED